MKVDVHHRENASEMKTKFIVEASNHPTYQEADEVGWIIIKMIYLFFPFIISKRLKSLWALIKITFFSPNSKQGFNCDKLTCKLELDGLE